MRLAPQHLGLASITLEELLAKLSYYLTVLFIAEVFASLCRPSVTRGGLRASTRVFMCSGVSDWRLSSCFSTASHRWKWQDLLCGILLQTNQGPGLADQVVSWVLALLGFLWLRSGCGQMVTTHVAWFGTKRMLILNVFLFVENANTSFPKVRNWNWRPSFLTSRGGCTAGNLKSVRSIWRGSQLIYSVNMIKPISVF